MEDVKIAEVKPRYKTSPSSKDEHSHVESSLMTRVNAPGDRGTCSPRSPHVIIDDIIPTASSPRASTQPNDVNIPYVKLRVRQDEAGSPCARISSPSLRTPRSASSIRSAGSPRSARQFGASRGFIDTTAPIESVKDAVSKFGGIVDWKAHKVQTNERWKVVDQELEKVQEEMPECEKKLKEAEASKTQVLQELDSTKRLVEELKLCLERAQMEEQQARQDFELAKLRLEEIKQGIADEASDVAKAQLQAAIARQTAAVSELKSVSDELEALRKKYASLITEKDEAVKKAEEAVSASKEVEKSVEELTIELVAAKESLESAHATYMESEEQRIGPIMASKQDSLHWERELKHAEDELQRLNQQILSAKDLKSKLDTASVLLVDLKAELAAYMESKLKEEISGCQITIAEQGELERKSHADVKAAVAWAKKELEEVKLNIEKATSEVNSLNVDASLLQSELEKEKACLAATTMQTEGMASIAIASLDIDKTMSETDPVQMQEKEAREKMAEMPKQLQQEAQATDEAKLLAQLAREELRKAKEEMEQAKAGASAMESRLLAAKKEIEAARASEKLALAAIKALHESETAQSDDTVDSPTDVTLSLEEYYELSKSAYEAEEQANLRVTTALSQIAAAKETESRTMQKLEEVNREMAEKKEALKVALDKAEMAKEGKLAVEQELRKWRAEQEQRRKASETGPTNPASSEGNQESKSSDQVPDAAALYTPSAEVNIQQNNVGTDDSSDAKVPKKKKKKSLFPRFFMFLGKKKGSSSKKV